jgi:hypothetical protein
MILIDFRTGASNTSWKNLRKNDQNTDFSLNSESSLGRTKMFLGICFMSDKIIIKCLVAIKFASFWVRIPRNEIIEMIFPFFFYF